MPIKRASFIIKGMSQDLAESKFNPQFAFENKNLRITASKDSNTYVLTTERGNLELTPSGDVALFGSPLGQCVIDNKLILFTHSNSTDGIFKLWFDGNTLKSKLLYSENLNFDSEHPIETLAVYESDSVKKVYWTDGLNQPRFINIESNEVYTDTSFDFISTIDTEERVDIEKQYSSASTFAPGVIQYFFTYYNKFGQESNIFYSSPLYYTTLTDKGAAPDATVGNIFKFRISHYSHNFDYIRIYSILRTSINAIPEARKIVDLLIPASGDINYIDTGIDGETIDPYRLLYVGGKVIAAETLTQKDGTLFLGNLKIQGIDTSVKPENSDINYIGTDYQLIPYSLKDDVSYDYSFQLNNPSNKIKGFKKGETYRLGYQLQDKCGNWSDVFYIDDLSCDKHFTTEVIDNEQYLKKPILSVEFTETAVYRWIHSDRKYRRIRPVIVFPSESERSVICQGVVNPTVYNVKDRYENTPFSQASWFFRPVPALDIFPSNLPYQHNSPLEANNSNYAEIQNLDTPAAHPYTDNVDDFIKNYPDSFFVDESIVTLNSPDIEFGNQSIIDTAEDIKFRIVGSIPITGLRAKYDIQTSTAPLAWRSNVAPGFLPYSIEEVFRQHNQDRPWETITSTAIWRDYEVDQKDPQNGAVDSDLFNYIIYPWHRDASLNNYPSNENSANAPAKLLKKRLIHYRYSPTNNYLDEVSYSGIESVNIETSDIKIFNSNEVTPIRFNSQSLINSYSKSTYLGNVNTATTHSGNYNIYSETYSSRGTSTTPVQIKYKSTPHALVICKIDDAQHRVNILPRFSINSDEYEHSQEGQEADDKYFWDKATSPSKIIAGYRWRNIKVSGLPSVGYLWLGELYRDSTPTFGGNTPEALLNNKWEVAGDVVNLGDDVLTGLTLRWTEGDTYYQRYDCLKTCPLSPEDKNGIVDILSFMCETRVNIDGRYDNNRGVLNTEITSENFNLINPVYSQHNNFFTYKVADEHRDTINKYPNVITWSGVKTYGEEIDTWANVTLTSTLELDGNKGEITALRRFNDNIIAFQDTGISQILYNENVQIPVTNGVPIEIGNSGRVQGKRYISNHIGCSNKWSICETSKGLYFIDSNLKDFYLFNGQINNLSQSLGMHTWICNNVPNGKWSPENYSEITQYDKTVGDVLITTENTCLAFNEDINTFTSLYDYNNTYPIVTIKDKTLACPSETAQLYLQHAGNYNVFFGNEHPKPYWTTIIVNQEPTADKIFNNIQFRGDCFNGDTYDYSKCPFDTLETSNEYQSGTLSLVNTKDKPSSLKKKFRTWYTLIPRDSSNHRDRMRNPWLKVTLSRQNDIGTDKAVIHDIAVDYFA